MRIVVEADAGEVAGRPEEAFGALADVAEADGADRDAWLAKAGGHDHAAEPGYQVVEDAAARAVRLYGVGVGMMTSAIRQRLERAAVDAAKEL